MPFRVTGCIVETESGRPVEGLLVRAYDKDLLVDDHLGDAHTDAAGRFEIVYTEVQFMDLHETLPDLYVRVYDRSGARMLHTTEREVRRDVRGDEHYEIQIPRTAP